MGKPIIARFFERPLKLEEHREFHSDTVANITRDIRNGDVFPALRENELHLYHEGGRILRITRRSVYTNAKYVGVSERTGDVPIVKRPLESLDPNKYQAIKNECSKHNRRPNKAGRRRETWIVSRLFKKFSYWSSEYKESGQPKIIDVECRFRNADRADKIDLLLLGTDGRLTFVEVKRQMDARIRAKEGEKPPGVTCQIGRYRKLVKNRQERTTVLDAYNKVSELMSIMLGLEGFDPPLELFRDVPILVFRESANKGQDDWLWSRLKKCEEGEIDSEYLVVDGGGHRGTYSKTPWCETGRWEDLDLKRILMEIERTKSCSQ